MKPFSSYLKNQYSAEDTIKLDLSHYDEKAKVWDNIFKSFLPKKEELPSVQGGVRVLELGCNTGYHTKVYEEVYGYAEGIDINQALIQASVLNSPNCKIMDICDLKYDNESFSLVVAKDVLEHAWSPDACLSEVHRVLCEDGVLVALIPLDGEVTNIDDVIVHDAFNYGNLSHTWKATYEGVMRRLLKLGFTYFEVTSIKHSELFGEVRNFGDTVLVVKCVKKSDVIKVPPKYIFGNSHWAAFVTLMCTGSCKYCIQNLAKDEFAFAKAEYEKSALSAAEWLEFLNRMQRFKNHHFSVIGGEPTIYTGFYELINGLENYYVTTTSNLNSPLFNSIERFVSNIKNKNRFRLNVSFHPKISEVDDFCSKVLQLRNAGIFVDQVAMVDYPGSAIKLYSDAFISRGVALNFQTFLGNIDGIQYPNSEYNDYGEHGINNRELFARGFSYKEKSPVLCMSRKLLFSPDGGIYRCCYHAYSNRGRIGHIRNEKIEDKYDYQLCNDFGFCNPCDFPNVNFRSQTLEVIDQLEGLVEDSDVPELEKIVSLSEHHEEVEKIIDIVASRLWLSGAPWWDLYNDEELIEAINEELAGSSFIDNSHMTPIVALEAFLFRLLKDKVNIFRIFKPDVLYKYLDAVSHYFSEWVESLDVLSDLYPSPQIARGFKTERSVIYSTVISLYEDVGAVHFSGEE